MKALQSNAACKFSFFTLTKKSGYPSFSIGICIVTKEVTEMEEKKEAGASIWVWVIIIAITAAVVAGFIIFLKP